MIILKYSFYYIYEPGFSPNLTRAYSTKVGSLTKRTFCKEKIILDNPIGYPYTSPAEHFENLSIFAQDSPINKTKNNPTFIAICR